MAGRRVGRAVAAGLAGVTAYDLLQRRHAILRNFPVVGHLRYLLEAIGPELRQYIVTSNDEERPFSRDQRRWVYASSKSENNYFGFGTDNDIERRRAARDPARAVPDRPAARPHARRLPDYAIPAGEGARRRARRRARVPARARSSTPRR